MPDTNLPFQDHKLSAYIAEPEDPGPWPGIVVIHDALGMTKDVRRQCDWLAKAGYLAAAPDLFGGGNLFNCIFTAIRQYYKRKGSFFDKIETTRQHLLNHPNSNKKVGVIGFCFGGGFAVILCAGYGFDAASVNYGPLPKDAELLLQKACPVVGSFGAKDHSLRGTPQRLEQILTDHQIDHDIKEYENAGHAFMNSHHPKDIPMVLKFFAFITGEGGYVPDATKDARQRIIAFFDRYLKA